MANYKDSKKTLTSTWGEILPANRNRTKLIIFNVGADNAGSFGLSNGTPIPIAAGGHIAFLTNAPTGAINGSSADGTDFVIWEA